MSKVLHTHVDVEIDRPTDQVWGVVSDYGTDTKWRKGIREMTADRPGEPEVGTRIREVLELAGKTYTTDTVVTEAIPGRRYTFAGEGTGGAVRGGRIVRPGPRPDTSVFTYHVEVEPHGVARLAQPVLGRMLSRSLRRDLERLRELIEAA